ncbi:hypothetical protein ACIPID_03875, partial [Cupriavidus sp. CER94]|uniref:hypothetical protein n=1 Tax=Cupriavidus sp. CER94 TaxID=3377036 RepID=UPI0038144DD2
RNFAKFCRQAHGQARKSANHLALSKPLGYIVRLPVSPGSGDRFGQRNPFRATRKSHSFVYQSAPANRSWEWSKP